MDTILTFHAPEQPSGRTFFFNCRPAPLEELCSPPKRTARSLLASARRHCAVLSCVGLTSLATAQAFPDRVAEFTPGTSVDGTTVTFGAAFFPGNVLGPPNGTTDGYTPTASPADLLSLGNGGFITLEFTSHAVVDLPGPDFTIFENPVAYRDYPEKSFPEAATVSVSEDGTSWTAFPFNFVPPETWPPSGTPFELYDMDRYTGFAGIRPVHSSPSNGISPFDPAVSGGDSFDLSQIGVSRARFIRIQDTGTTGPTQTVDPDGQIVDDPGNHLFGTETAGFDLDAVAALHTASTLTAVRREEWALYE